MDSVNDNDEIPFYHSTSTSLTGDAVLDMLKAMHNKESIIPPSVTSHYLARSGCNVSDPNVVSLVSFSTQKLIQDILHSAKEHKMVTDTNENRSKHVSSANIQYAIASYGVELCSPPYLLDGEVVTNPNVQNLE